MKVLRMRMIFTLLIFSFVFASSTYSQEPRNKDSWMKAKAIKGLPFGAFILGNLPKGIWGGREIYVLMDQAEVTESNLRTLFQLLADSKKAPIDLRIWVMTDAEQLKEFYSDGGLSGEGTRVLRGAFYRREENQELFRYNPKFPEPGMVTIRLKGKQ